jgi:hypothetical protein
MASSLDAGCRTRHAVPENGVPTSRPFDGALQFRTIESGRLGCDLTFLLIGHRVDFDLLRFGINEEQYSTRIVSRSLKTV